MCCCSVHAVIVVLSSSQIRAICALAACNPKRANLLTFRGKVFCISVPSVKGNMLSVMSLNFYKAMFLPYKAYMSIVDTCMLT